MSDQQLFAKARLMFLCAAANNYLGRKPGEVAPPGKVVGAENQRNKCRSTGNDLQIELTCYLIAERRRTHLWDGQAARGHDERVRSEDSMRRLYAKSARRATRRRDRDDPRTGNDADFCLGALALQHGHDIKRGSVAEELPQRLLVETDSMLCY